MSVTIQQRISQLRKAQANVPKMLHETAKEATLAAIEAAQARTPPKEGTGRAAYIGANTISGQLKAAWEKDSVLEPVVSGKKVETVLANHQEYASYVDQGHRMDRHFVPGLYVDPESGLLSCDPQARAGLVVGVRTKYVKGEFMVDAAKEAYAKACRQLLEQRIVELMK